MAKIIESKTKLRIRSLSFEGDTYVVKTEQGITVNIFSPLKQNPQDLAFMMKHISEGDDFTVDQIRKMFPNHYVTWF